jgi:hypothetical protein
MFALYPDGKNEGESRALSPFYNNISFFGKLGIYFVGIRLAYLYFGDRQALEPKQ